MQSTALGTAVQVAEQLPRWSGEVLDLVIDFTTCVRAGHAGRRRIDA
jgi:hypothetical protein